MSTLIDTATYKGYTIEIHSEDFPEDPLSWATPEERGATFVLHHSKYDLPNELDIDFDDYESWQDLMDKVAKDKPYKFVNWYEHGAVSVSLQDSDVPSDKWDAGIAGIIFGDTEQDIEAIFQDWKHYIEGDIYGYVISNPKGEEVDSLCGLNGYDFTLESATEAVDQLTKK